MMKTRSISNVYQLASDPSCPEYTLTYSDGSEYWRWCNEFETQININGETVYRNSDITATTKLFDDNKEWFKVLNKISKDAADEVRSYDLNCFLVTPRYDFRLDDRNELKLRLTLKVILRSNITGDKILLISVWDYDDCSIFYIKPGADNTSQDVDNHLIKQRVEDLNLVDLICKLVEL